MPAVCANFDVSGSLEGAMDCMTQADAGSIPASNLAGVFSATAWYRVLFRAFASSGATFSPQRCCVQPSAISGSALGVSANSAPPNCKNISRGSVERTCRSHSSIRFFVVIYAPMV